MSAVSVAASTSFARKDRSGSSPRTALQQFRVAPIPISTAKSLLVRHHYLHSLPGGTQLAFGVFLDSRLMGALTIGCGPSQAYRLVQGARPEDCAVLICRYRFPGRPSCIVSYAMPRHRAFPRHADPSQDRQRPSDR